MKTTVLKKLNELKENTDTKLNEILEMIHKYNVKLNRQLLTKQKFCR